MIQPVFSIKLPCHLDLVLYDERMTRVLIGRLTHHVELILFPGGNNRLRESSINEAWGRINTQEVGNHGKK
jgi:hypothetical protein